MQRLESLAALGALSAHATWDMAGRLLFNDHDTALRYAQARAFMSRSRQRVSIRATYLPGYRFHVSAVVERPAATEAELTADGIVHVEPCS